MSKIVTLIAFLVLTLGINRPLAGQHDWNSVFFGNAARNHTRLGLIKTKLGVVTNVNPLPTDTLNYYTHHPILMPLLLAGSLAIFGITDWAIRLIPVISATIMIYFLSKLVKKLWDIKTALLSVFFLTFSPILLYYSKIPIHETVVLGFLGFTLWAYIIWLKTNKLSFYYLTILGLILSQLTSWAGYYLSLYLPLHSLLFSHFPRRKLLTLFLIAPVMFLLHNLHSYWLTGSFTSLFQAFTFRVNPTASTQIFGFTYPQFFILQARWIVIYFTRILTGLSLIWLVGFLTRLRRRSISLPDSFIVLLLIFGFTHNLIFRQQAFIHDYTLVYLLPFFALAPAVILSRLHHLLRRLNYLILFIILILFATERLSYLKALWRSGDANPGVPLGKAINRLTDSSQTTLILNTELMRFYDVFINFYADRKVIAADKLTPQLLDEVNYIIIPSTHDYVSSRDKNWLYRNLSHRLITNGTLFYVH